MIIVSFVLLLIIVIRVMFFSLGFAPNHGISKQLWHIFERKNMGECIFKILSGKLDCIPMLESVRVPKKKSLYLSELGGVRTHKNGQDEREISGCGGRSMDSPEGNDNDPLLQMSCDTMLIIIIKLTITCTTNTYLHLNMSRRNLFLHTVVKKSL